MGSMSAPTTLDSAIAAGSWMVGDSDSDVDAGNNYGVKTIQTTKLLEAVERILEEAR